LQPDKSLQRRLEALACSNSPGAADARDYLHYLGELHVLLIFSRAAVAIEDRQAGKEPEVEFRREVETAFAELLTSGHLRVAESIYDEEHFGNAIVELAGAKFHVRLVKDRDEIRAEITIESPTPRGGNWISLPMMIRAVGVKDDLPDANSMSGAAALVTRYGAEIESGISPERLGKTRVVLQKIQAEAEQMFWLQTKQLQLDAAEKSALKAPDQIQSEERQRQEKMPTQVKAMLGNEDQS
jgi:hypothetical protein